jgi:MYXO-CTERM domain-containing protein
MVGYGAGAYQLTMFDRVQLYEHSDCGEKDIGEYPDAGPVLPGDGGNSGGGNGFGGRTGIACACQGGPGSASTGVAFAVVGLLVLRRRRR